MDSVASDWFWFWLPLLVVVVVRALAVPSSLLVSWSSLTSLSHHNSIYVYNKNAINLIPQSTVLAIKLIKSYFNLYNYRLEREIRANRLLLRLRRLSSHKIYVSNGEFKHTNDKVIITLYIYNRQKFNFDKKLIKSFYSY